MKYDSSKSYSWSNNEEFILSGQEFGLVLNTLRAILSTEQAAQILLADRANDILERIMERGVEEGKLIEKDSPNIEK